MQPMRVGLVQEGRRVLKMQKVSSKYELMFKISIDSLKYLIKVISIIRQKVKAISSHLLIYKIQLKSIYHKKILQPNLTQ